MDWETQGFVLAGALRTKIVLLLEEPKTPTTLAELIKTQDSAIARSLRDLEKQGVVNCLNPAARKGKLFALTAAGEAVRQRIANAPASGWTSTVEQRSAVAEKVVPYKKR